MSKPSAPSAAYQGIGPALAALDRADRARLRAQVEYETAERAVFAAIGRAIAAGDHADDRGLDDDELGSLPAPVLGALDVFAAARDLALARITYRDAMWRARDAEWMAGRGADPLA